MKSRIISLYNYMELPLENMDVEVSDQDIASEIDTDTKKELLMHKQMSQVDKVQLSDVVTVSMKSKKNRYQRDSLNLNAGMGLFDTELEKLLVGHSVGETFSIVKKDSTQVEITILDCRRTIIPKLDDNLVQSLGKEGISTVQQYKDAMKVHYMSFYKEGYTSYFADDLFAQMCQNSQWDCLEEELEQCYQWWHKLQKENQEFHSEISSESDEETDAQEREDSEYILRLMLVSCLFTGKDSKKISFEGMSMNSVTELRNQVMKPLENYLSDKVRIIVKEEV